MSSPVNGLFSLILKKLVIASKHKILFVLPTNTFGGAETVTFNIIKGIRSFEPVLFIQERMNKFYSSLGITIYNFEDYNCLVPDISLSSIISYSKAISNVSKLIQPSIIFGVMHFASLFITLARDLFFLKIPTVTSIHGTYSSHFKSINRSPNLTEKLLINYLLKRTKNIIVPSLGIKSDIITHFDIPDEKFKVIYNGFDLDWIRACGMERISMVKDCKWIATASRLGPPKDFNTLLNAFRIIRDQVKTKLLIIGGGPYEQKIREEVAELKLNEDVYMVGFQENPFKYIAKSDVFVLSSLSEGLPGSLIEAMALGVPVASTDCPSGPSEIIESGKNGILVPVGDAHSLASACISVLNDSELKNRLSAGGLERADYFSIQRMSREYNDYFVHLLS